MQTAHIFLIGYFFILCILLIPIVREWWAHGLTSAWVIHGLHLVVVGLGIVLSWWMISAIRKINDPAAKQQTQSLATRSKQAVSLFGLGLYIGWLTFIGVALYQLIFLYWTPYFSSLNQDQVAAASIDTGLFTLILSSFMLVWVFLLYPWFVREHHRSTGRREYEYDHTRGLFTNRFDVRDTFSMSDVLRLEQDGKTIRIYRNNGQSLDFGVNDKTREIFRLETPYTH